MLNDERITEARQQARQAVTGAIADWGWKLLVIIHGPPPYIFDDSVINPALDLYRDLERAEAVRRAARGSYECDECEPCQAFAEIEQATAEGELERLVQQVEGAGTPAT